MTIAVLTSKLSAIWYVNDSENENKEFIVERRNVKPLVERFLVINVTLAQMPDLISDNALECKQDDVILNSDIAFEEMLSRCNAYGQLSLEDVFQSQKNGQAFGVDAVSNEYVELCHRIGAALGIDTSDAETNADYWACAWQDGLSPYQAVLDSL